MNAEPVSPVCEQFAGLGLIRQIEPLSGAGGFSGARLWRVTAEAGPFCLRRWPLEHPSPERLAWIHTVQRHLGQAGLTFIPVPLRTVRGETFSQFYDHLWELVPWMPGQADYHRRPSPLRLAAALSALSRVHVAAARMPGELRSGVSPGLASRLDQLRELLSGGLAQLEEAVSRRPLAWHELARRILKQIRTRVPRTLAVVESAVPISVPLFPCLRDVWHDHILFTGDEVTGIIDFGAMRVESPAGDIARLVGSLVADQADGWRAALAAYAAIRPLETAERRLIAAFDASGVLLSAANWVTWLYAEGREFDDAAAVARRMEEIAARLEGAGSEAAVFDARG